MVRTVATIREGRADVGRRGEGVCFECASCGSVTRGPLAWLGSRGVSWVGEIMSVPWHSPLWSGLPRRLRDWCAVGSEAIGGLALPWECPICRAEGEGTIAPFCFDCRAELLDAAGEACPRCAMPVGPWGKRPDGCGECRGNRQLGFDAAVGLGPYQGPIRGLCLQLKHEREGWLAPWLADLLLEARPSLREEARGEPGAWVVPVPLHWKRHWSRGYNQAEELARGLATEMGLRSVNVLRRVVPTQKLAGLGRVERSKALQGAFQVRSGWGPGLKGRTVFLVDDVLTTGATCGTAARALKRGGAARVVAVVVGRAEGRF
ncbi:MAG: hypothetical protein NVSMB9_30060 [Isosphaeraceae bacterium]